MSSLNIHMRNLLCLLLSVFLASCGSGGGGTSASTPPANSAWTVKQPPPTRRHYAAAVVYDNKLYIIGGLLINSDPNSTYGAVTGLVEIYDPATNTWTTGVAMPTARMGLVAAVAKVANNETIFAIGGSTGVSSAALGVVEEFAPGMGTWTTHNPITPRMYSAAASFPVTLDQHIVVVGGESGAASLDYVDQYNPLTGFTTALTQLPTPRGRLALVGSGSKLYAIGGYSRASSQWLKTVEEYDSVMTTWTTRSAMLTERGHAVAALLNGQVLVAGGEKNAGQQAKLNVLESYDPISNTWTTKTPAPSTFTRAAGGVIGNKLYIVADGLTLEYDPAKETL